MSKPGPSTSGGSEPSPSTSGEGNPKKPSYFSLTKKTLPELKKMCADAKLPRTGNKSQLMSSLIWGFKPNYESLGKLNVAEMKKMCADANLPKTGTKDQLMARIIDGGSGQTAQKKGGKGQKSAQKEAVNKLFRDAGEDPNQINKCLKAGVLNGHVPLTEEGKLNLDQVLHKGRCDSCREELTCTIRDALYQREYAGLDYEDGGYYAAVHCEIDRCGNYITGICNGQITFDSGKYHNHCGRCANFGHCIGDYRNRCNGKPGRNGQGQVRWVGLC